MSSAYPRSVLSIESSDLTRLYGARPRFGFIDSIARDAFPHAAQPARALFQLHSEQLQLSLIEPDSAALIAAVDLNAFKSMLDKRAIALRTLNNRRLGLFFFSPPDAEFLDQFLLFAAEVFVLERLLAVVPDL